MIHYVHIVNPDPERAAAAGKSLLLLLAAWLAWHFLPEGLTMLDTSLGGWPGAVLHVVALPFVWLGSILHAIVSAFVWTFGAVESAFRIASFVQAVLLPVWAAVVGCYIGRKGLQDGLVMWLVAAGLNALCAVLLGYPVLGVMEVVGSIAAYVATRALNRSLRSRTGWLALALVAGLSVWGAMRYGAAISPVCWPLVPASWACLALGAAYGTRRVAGCLQRPGVAARLLLLACAMAMAAIGPFAGDVARAAGLLTSVALPASPSPALAAVARAPLNHETAVTPLPAQQPGPADTPHRIGRDAKPASASHSKRPRTQPCPRTAPEQSCE